MNKSIWAEKSSFLKIALKRVLTLPKARSRQMRQFPLKFMGLQNKNISVVTKHWTNIIFVPMSYISPKSCKKLIWVEKSSFFKIALKYVLTLPKARSQQMRQFPLKNMGLQNKNISVVTKHWKYRISVPKSYISDTQLSKCCCKLIELLLKSRIFPFHPLISSFNYLLACRGERRIQFLKVLLQL